MENEKNYNIYDHAIILYWTPIDETRGGGVKEIILQG